MFAAAVPPSVRIPCVCNQVVLSVLLLIAFAAAADFELTGDPVVDGKEEMKAMDGDTDGTNFDLPRGTKYVSR